MSSDILFLDEKGGYSSMGLLEPTSTSTLRRMRKRSTMQNSLFIKTDSCSEDRPLTVSELNQSVLTADPQIIEFLCTAKVIQSEKGGVILAAVDVLRRYHVELSAADQTDDALFGDQHEQVQNPIASMVPAGNSSTVVEIVDNLAAKLGETTDVNHQTPSSTVPEGGRPASSTPPVDRYESEKKKLRLA
ncbi:hypothetical protein YC2023_032639 [Brassica napus]